jgi:hypothetical protein
LPLFENGLVSLLLLLLLFESQLLLESSQFCPVICEKRWFASFARDFENGSKS